MVLEGALQAVGILGVSIREGFLGRGIELRGVLSTWMVSCFLVCYGISFQDSVRGRLRSRGCSGFGSRGFTFADLGSWVGVPFGWVYTCCAHGGYWSV